MQKKVGYLEFLGQNGFTKGLSFYIIISVSQGSAMIFLDCSFLPLWNVVYL